METNIDATIKQEYEKIRDDLKLKLLPYAEFILQSEVSFTSFPEKHLSKWDPAQKMMSAVQKETIKKNLIEKQFEEKMAVILRYKDALLKDKVYFKLGEEEYKKVLTKWMSLATVKFYASLKDKVVNIPFSINACYKEQSPEEVEMFFKLEIICAQIYSKLMNRAKKEGIELKSVSQKWIDASLPQIREDVKKMNQAVNNRQEKSILNSEKLTGEVFTSFHVGSYEFNQIYKDALLAGFSADETYNIKATALIQGLKDSEAAERGKIIAEEGRKKSEEEKKKADEREEESKRKYEFQERDREKKRLEEEKKQKENQAQEEQKDLNPVGVAEVEAEEANVEGNVEGNGEKVQKD